MRLDISIYDKNDRLTVIGEVKRRSGLPVSWASRLRYNLLSENDVAKTDYFLIALLDHFYLWKGIDSPLKLRPPDFVGDTMPILDSYLQRTHLNYLTIAGEVYEEVVLWWLDDLISGVWSAYPNDIRVSWIFDSGLFDAIRNGHMEKNLMFA